LEAIAAMGYQEPTPIQAQAIPFLLENQQDLIALAQTGTGKTAAFSLPCLHKLNAESLDTQVIILSPTRELALQTAKEIKKFSKKLTHLKSVALYGGADYGSQSRALSKGCQVVVGTPGRTLDFIRQGRLDLSTVTMVVLDEADEMLKMGFKEDLEAILDETPDEKQVLLFSATMPTGIERIAKRTMVDPHRIAVAGRNQANRNVKHQYCVIHPADRFAALRRWVDVLPNMEGIIFCRTRAETMEIYAGLSKEGYAVDILNGDLKQEARDRVMRRFHRKELKILVATDVAARGLDVDDLSHVLNYTLPDDLEVYIHRSGRTGRAGKEGVSVTLVTPKEEYRIRQIEKMSGIDVNKSPIPTTEDVVSSQLNNAITSLQQATLPEGQFEDQVAQLSEVMQAMEPTELATKVLSLMSGSLLSQYQKEIDLNARAQDVIDRKKRKRRDRDGKGRDGRGRDRGRDKRDNKRKKFTPKPGNYTTCQVNIGRKHKLNPNRLMGLVNERIKGKKPDFGEIRIEATSTTFDVESKSVPAVIASLMGASFEGRSVKARTV
jgi:ATP-dependent RNA helicase DeaD